MAARHLHVVHLDGVVNRSVADLNAEWIRVVHDERRSDFRSFVRYVAELVVHAGDARCAENAGKHRAPDEYDDEKQGEKSSLSNR
ncbi:hypothetical protein ACFFQF_00485 [Haladaptatus pallidirubidus]